VQHKLRLLDHLVGAAEQRKRARNPQRLASFEVKYQLDVDGLLDRQDQPGLSPLKPNCWVLLRQFARCRDGEAELFGRH
jgi:hypothetical protein